MRIVNFKVEIAWKIFKKMTSRPEKTNTNEWIVLKNCRELMKSLGLIAESNTHIFRSNPKIAVPVWIIQLIYSIPMCTCVMLAFGHIFDKNMDLTKSSVALIIIVGGGQSHIIYFLLIAKNKSLSNIIDQLQKLVDKRKWFLSSSAIALSWINCGKANIQ